MLSTIREWRELDRACMAPVTRGAGLGDRVRFDSGSLRECVSQTPDRPFRIHAVELSKLRSLGATIGGPG